MGTSPCVQVAAALAMLGAVIVILQLPSASVSSQRAWPRRLDLPIILRAPSPVGAPSGASVPTIGRGRHRFSRYLSVFAKAQSPYGAPAPGATQALPPWSRAPPMTRGGSSPSSKSRSALIVGLSVTGGVVLGAVLVGVLVFWCVLRRKSQCVGIPPVTHDKMPVRPGGDSWDKRTAPGDEGGADKRPGPQEASLDKRAIGDT